MLGTIWAEVWDVVSTEPLSFVIGAVVGYALRGRYRFVRERIDDKKEDR